MQGMLARMKRIGMEAGKRFDFDSLESELQKAASRAWWCACTRQSRKGWVV